MVAKLETVNVRNTFQKIVKEKPHCSHSSNIFEPLIRHGKNPHGNSAPLEHMAFFWLDVFSQLIGSSLPMFNLRGFDSTDFYTCLLILDRIAVAYVISVAGTLKLRNLFFKSEKYCECCSSWVRALACKDGIHSIDKPQCMFCS